ncbi:hypothetical protein [Acinetobacter johnsonii]|uniref:hypothetical protein n=1 Tax=Acinetobacter johnsonii TaxID=40214 RepID=UPI00143AFBC8|nr:hypothetical protein [Acinetobacter johnsonii]NKG36480.1 hypothetical protein [Acinetobacter johnsonii]
MNKIILSSCLGLTVFCTMNSAYAIDAKYRAKLERSGCTEVSEMQGCDINKTKAENAKAGFGTNTSVSSNTYAGQWIAKNSSTGQTVATIRVDNSENVWINGQKVKARRSDGGLVFKQGFVTFKLEGNPADRSASSWYDSDAQTSGPIRKK